MSNANLTVVAAVLSARCLVPVMGSTVMTSLASDPEVHEEPRQPLSEGGAPPVPSHAFTMQCVD
jgi:hypothetical protein